DAPRTSAKTSSVTRQNLTLSDWMQVYSFIDNHPTTTQANIVQHFCSLETGALLFDQSTLSCKL
ncbi:hypothetical protein M404DRAFT_97074, partial [Pisolithus tinctorius Marx 270]